MELAWILVIVFGTLCFLMAVALAYMFTKQRQSHHHEDLPDSALMDPSFTHHSITEDMSDSDEDWKKLFYQELSESSEAHDKSHA